MVLKRIFNMVVDRIVRPIARHKVKQVLKENLRDDLIFAFLVVVGAVFVAWYFGATAGDLTDYYLVVVGLIATFRLGRLLYRYHNYYKESHWLTRKILRICVRSILTDTFILLLIAGYILLATLVWFGRSVGIVWLLN